MAQNRQIQDDPYARDSFSFRRMTRGQAWAITVVAVVVLAAAAVYSYGGF